MRTVKFFVVGALAAGLFACQPKNDVGEYEPYPEDEEALFCQEICTLDTHCLGGLVCSGDCDPDVDDACGAPNTCVECKNDAGCPGAFCIAGECVECVDDSACTVPGATHCFENACSECAEDVDCGPGAPRCLDGVCTCAGSAQCAADERCMYTTDSIRPGSVPGCVCKDNSACAGIGPEICIVGICIECEFDAHCEALVGPGSKCFDGGTLFSYCGCSTDADCDDGYCVGSECVECRNGTDCVSGQCEANACVECTVDAHCTSNHCLDNLCVECLADAECGDGKCVANACVQCREGADCVALQLGSVCAEGECQCTADSECAGIVENGGSGVCLP